MGYRFPSMDLLKFYNPKNNFTNREYVQAMGEELSSVLESFKVKCRITDIRMTPFAVLFDVIHFSRIVRFCYCKQNIWTSPTWTLYRFYTFYNSLHSSMLLSWYGTQLHDI